MVQVGLPLNLKKLSVMANNFRITGASYVSKGGHDSNDGLTPDSPKKTLIQTYPNGAVVGAGLYYVNSRVMGGTTAIKTFAADGTVIIDFGGVALGFHENPYNNIFDGFHFKNSPAFYNFRGSFYRCTFQDLASSTGLGSNTLRAYDCKFVNYTSISAYYVETLRCIFLSSNYIASGPIRDSYFDNTSNLLFSSATPPPSILTYCNVRGVVVIGSVKYAIQDQFTGTPQDNGYAADVYWLNEANLTANGYTGTIAGWDAAVATCINRDPKFNNASKLDFTLQADSPHIGRASDGFSNIGGTEYAQSFYAGISNPNILLFEVSEAIDTTSNNNDWRLKSGYTEGWIRAIIKVSNNDVQISSIPYIGNYSFDSDQTGGSSTNMNVPDSKPITNEYPDYLTVTTQAANDTTLIIAGHGAVVGDWLWVDGQYREITGVPDADTVTFATSLRAIVIVGTVVKIGTFEALASLNPNRLNMKMRSSKLVDVNASNWDNPLTWDNDGLSPSGQYMAQEWNNAPMIDSLNEVGFGDDSYDANYGNPINLKVVDIMIYLRNNYRS